MLLEYGGSWRVVERQALLNNSLPALALSLSHMGSEFAVTPPIHFVAHSALSYFLLFEPLLFLAISCNLPTSTDTSHMLTSQPRGTTTASK